MKASVWVQLVDHTTSECHLLTLAQVGQYTTHCVPLPWK